MRSLFSSLAAVLLAWLGAAAQAADLPYSAAVAARFPDPERVYVTPGLQPGRDTFTTATELSQLLRGLAAGGPAAPRLVQVGRSQRGEAIEGLHFTRGGGRPVVLLIGQQHGDEPAGAEALLVVAQDLAAGQAPAAAALDHVDVLIVPRANPDGAAYGTRRGAHGLDVNRDHLLLRTPEAQALAAVVREWNPLVVADLHEHTVIGRYLAKFAAIQRHDMLLQSATVANLPAALERAADELFRQPIVQALAGQGLRSEWYYTNSNAPADLRLAMGGAQPDTARNVQGLRHSVSLLLESRGVGIGRLHLQRRVHSHVVAVNSILRSAAAHAADVAALRARLNNEVAQAACKGEITVLAGQTPLKREILMLDPATGADVSLHVQWLSSLELRNLVKRRRPCGYWLQAGAEDAVRRLQALGLQVQRLAEPAELAAERWEETSRFEGRRPDVRGSIDDGYEARMVQVALRPAAVPAAAGSWYLPLNQPLAHLAVAALEPDSPNSYYANRVLPDLDSAARVVEPPAIATGKSRN
ncbi:MAG TPA: M14 family metallocarboxypeptidase [Rubrivivax sp.]|nr:M14 family metallocarboxypeptidase [Rubrivivax sp.]